MQCVLVLSDKMISENILSSITEASELTLKIFLSKETQNWMKYWTCIACYKLLTALHSDMFFAIITDLSITSIGWFLKKP